MRTRRKKNKVLWFVVLMIPVLLVVGIIAQISFDRMVDFRLKQLESQNVAYEPQIEPQTAETEEAYHYYLINEAEREIIERVVMAEARGSGYVGMLPVAQTILDRCLLWKMTPIEVVTQDAQYADAYDGEISADAMLAVSDVFDQGLRAYDEPITHFYSGEAPYWAEGKTSRGSVAGHTFMY